MPLPLRKYKALADAYGFILVSSNNSRKMRNDWPAWKEAIWSRLVRGRYTGESCICGASVIYTCGFSGGAKVASYLAIEHGEIKGVIANGAALPDGVSAGDFPVQLYGYCG